MKSLSLKNLKLVVFISTLSSFFSLNAMDVAIFLGKYTAREDAVLYNLYCSIAQKVPIIASSALVRSIIDLAAMPIDPYLQELIDKATAEINTHLKKQLAAKNKINDLNNPQNSIPDDEKQLEINLNTENFNLRQRIIENREKDIEVYKKASVNLQKLRKDLIEELKNNTLWKLYMSPAKETTILIPVGYRNTGKVSTNFLQEIQNEQLEATVEEFNYPISPRNILACIEGVCDKHHPRIFLNGHGTAGIIAELDEDEYRIFIKGLIALLCDLLYVESCFAGGKNQITMHQNRMSSILEKFDISFPTILGSITDAPTLVLQLDMDRPDYYKRNFRIEKFFQTVNEFFQNPGTLTPSHWTKEPFKKMCTDLLVERVLANAPLIRLPGLTTAFSALDIDNKILCLNYPKLIYTELELRKRKVTQAQDRNKQPNDKKYVIDISNKEAVLLYPSVLKIPLRFNGNNAPKIISMISGFGRHYIESIIAPNCSLDDLLSKMFIKIYKPTHVGGLGLKAGKNYFIKELFCKNYNKSGILHPRTDLDNETEDLQLTDVKILSEIDQSDKKLRLMIGFNCNGRLLMCLKTISEDEEIKIEFDEGKVLDVLILDPKPLSEALSEATGGIESDRQFEELVQGRGMKQKIEQLKQTRTKKWPTVEIPELQSAPLEVQGAEPILAPVEMIQ